MSIIPVTSAFLIIYKSENGMHERHSKSNISHAHKQCFDSSGTKSVFIQFYLHSRERYAIQNWQSAAPPAIVAKIRWETGIILTMVLEAVKIQDGSII